MWGVRTCAFSTKAGPRGAHTPTGPPGPYRGSDATGRRACDGPGPGSSAFLSHVEQGVRLMARLEGMPLSSVRVERLARASLARPQRSDGIARDADHRDLSRIRLLPLAKVEVVLDHRLPPTSGPDRDEIQRVMSIPKAAQFVEDERLAEDAGTAPVARPINHLLRAIPNRFPRGFANREKHPETFPIQLGDERPPRSLVLDTNPL